MKKTDLWRLLLNTEKTITLLTMGIEPSSCFYYRKYVTGEAITWHPGIGPAEEEDTIPAWTYEEIRTMIGSSMAAGYVDIPFNFHPNIKGVELRFCVNDLSGQKPFTSGVDALGEVLIKMIDNGVVEVDDCNTRYAKVYKPQ